MATAASSLVDLRQNAWAGLEQQEANLVASEPRIEAQHVVGERRQLAQQLDADQAAADHDDRQAAASRRRIRTPHRRARIVRSGDFCNTSASAIVLNVKAFDEPGISCSFVDAPSATTRWSYGSS